MRLPPSTIVLAVATCIPFGLAIRDTLAGTYDLPDRIDQPDEEDELDDDELRERELRRMAEQEALYRERQEAEKEQRREVLRALYADDVAVPGPLFDAQHLGDPAAELGLEAPRGMSLVFANDGETVHTLSARIFSRPDGECEKLQANLRVAWGEPKSLDNRWIWVNGKLGQRAVWNFEDCELAYEAQLPHERWLSEIPIQLLGKRVEELHELLGKRVATSLSADHSQWSMLGFGTGYGVVEMSTDNVGGKLVAITAALHINVPTRTLLVEQITKLVGNPPDGAVWTATRTTPRFELRDGVHTTLIIGTRHE